jgi:hypothetical protein
MEASMHVYQWAGAGAGVGPNTYVTTAATMDGLHAAADPTAAVGYTFVTTAPPIRAMIQGVPHPALRVSDNGGLAVEDADLTRRQPRSFFADQGLIPDWNQALTRAGSLLQLIPELPTVTLLPPAGGAPRTLVRVRPANLSLGNAGDQMTITENCDGNVGDVTGAVGEFEPVFGRQIFRGTTPFQQGLFDHFAAIALTAGLPHAHPLNTDLPAATPAAVAVAQNGVAAVYGQALRAIAGGAANPALTNDMQVLGINEHARPTRIGQGLRTASLGVVPPGGVGPFQVTDHLNNRILQHPVAISNVMWGGHWGGVVAVDGTDYITLENYNRLREWSPAATAAAVNQPLTNEGMYYVQMYGPGAASWHVQWATPTVPIRGKQFADALTTLVEPRQRQAMQYFVPNSKNMYAAVSAAAMLPALQRALLNGLNYANVHRHSPVPIDRVADRTRLGHWRNEVNMVLNNPPPFAAGPQPTALAQHVYASLADVTTN